MQENIFFNFAANLDLMIKSSFSFPDTPFSMYSFYCIAVGGRLLINDSKN